jgi:hypothetical protein
MVPRDWDVEADVVVVGFGAAGACAALEAPPMLPMPALPMPALPLPIRGCEWGRPAAWWWRPAGSPRTGS